VPNFWGLRVYTSLFAAVATAQKYRKK